MGDVLTLRRPQPTYGTFVSAEDAWFWTMRSLIARRDGVRLPASSHEAYAATPDDVVKILDTLYRQRRLELAHARILRIWGERGLAPRADFPSERSDARLWREAMDAMAARLRAKGLLA